MDQGEARGRKTEVESGSLETKAEPESWRTRVMPLGRRAEVEPGDSRTKAEMGAWKTEVEPEGARMMVETNE